ncbi:methyl-accepting chemotaxis protein [Haliangium ochraceum]|uniref:Methyl-accepting chemotaxis sensory transducer n=1 Tax=Haliangium ochraceum (strain DSM 14365 / JCM 11303 / SMP-2) TaxID=502025 RepID=D0LTR2_HALO1|nr:methyl-accepting chemotaxis protein [Haliangium ochraceum]ACY15756.1 methyl-accepting chemotaxis sensory transducer [Haliangium ochraceum DSM 14365]
MRWTVAGKIAAGFGVLVAFILGLATVQWYESSEVNEQIERMYQSGVEGTRELGEAYGMLQRIRGRVFYHVAVDEAAAKQEVESQIGSNKREFEERLEAAEDLAKRYITDGDTRAKYLRHTAEIRDRFETYMRMLTDGVMRESRIGDSVGALSEIRETKTVVEELIAEFEVLMQLHVASNQSINRDVDDTLKIAQAVSLVGSLAALLAAMLVGWLMARSISSRLRSVATVAGRVSQGQLDERAHVTGHDEITQVATALNEMAAALAEQIAEANANAAADAAKRQSLADSVARYGEFVERVARGELTAMLEVGNGDSLGALGNNLSAMVKALRTMTLRTHEAVGALSTASAEILATIQEHGASANESASAVAETAATVDEVHQSSQRVAEQAQHVAEASQQSVEVSTAGRRAVDHTVSTMRDVRSQVDTIAERILMLSEQAQAVSQIITTVNELAEQSNLLALNASIEAARAGEEGRGFAVVAKEIRVLADQSREATAQVRSILGEIQKSTTQAVLETERGSNAAAQAEDAVRAAGAHIDQLAETIDESSQAAQHILAASKQQVAGVSQISQAMHSITEASRQTVEGTRNVESAVRDLNQLSGNLRDAVAQYRI